MQQILNYGPLESGLALLPMILLIMTMMIWITPKLIGRLGLKLNMIAGLYLLTVGILLFSLTPTPSDNNNGIIFMMYVLPASIIPALAMSFSYIRILTTAVANAKKKKMQV